MVMSNRVPFDIAISRNARVAQKIVKLFFAGQPSRPKHNAATWRGEDGSKEGSDLGRKPTIVTV